MDNIVSELRQKRELNLQFQYRIKFLSVIKQLNERNLQKEKAKNAVQPVQPKGWIAWFFGY